jgi:hypothetical protein
VAAPIKLLEEAPGVQSIARWVALLLTILVAVVVGTVCFINIYAVVHGKDAALLATVGSLTTTLTLFCAPVIGGIWVALGLRKRSSDNGAAGTAEIRIPAPAGAQPTVTVTPPAPSPGS